MTDVAPLAWRSHTGLRWLRWTCGDVTAAFATREGGVSPAPWSSLNLGLLVGDDGDRVRENRRRLCAALDLPPHRLVVPHQVHGTALRWVGEAEAGRGARTAGDAIADHDGLLCETPDVGLAVSTADCLPVVIVAATADGFAFAAVHAGWRGALAGIAGRAAIELARRGRLLAAVIGPGIGPCCFVVDDDLRARFADRHPTAVRSSSVDLPAVVAEDLRRAGVPADAIARAGVCTSCDERFFSHRRDRGLTGRHLAIAWRHAGAATGRPSGAGRQG